MDGRNEIYKHYILKTMLWSYIVWKIICLWILEVHLRRFIYSLPFLTKDISNIRVCEMNKFALMHDMKIHSQTHRRSKPKTSILISMYTSFWHLMSYKYSKTIWILSLLVTFFCFLISFYLTFFLLLLFL